MIRVRVLGAVEFQVGSSRIGMNTELLFALALYLTTRAGERIPREDLLERFWAKGPETQRRHALRQMLYRLRQKGLTLDEDGERVMLLPSRVESDVRSALSSGWEEHATTAEIDAAAVFTPTFSRRLAPGFLEWVDEVRERVSAQHRKASLRQIYIARREGRWADLERWAHGILRNDPFNEEATLARAESAAMAGSKTMAIEILDTYLTEVGEISGELGKPVLALRKRLAERRSDWTQRGPKEVPLVGRTELMSRLTGLVEAAWRGEGSAVVLVGAPGIGKTRLAMEARGYAELKGMRTVVVRAEAANRERPLALILGLSSAVVQLPGAAGSAAESLGQLQRLSAARPADRVSVGVATDSMRDALVDALEDVIDAVASERRIMIILDDLHHADAPSKVVLAPLWSRSARKRVMWLGTSRRAISDAAPEERFDRSWSELAVPPLLRNESIALVDAVLRAHRLSLDGELVDAISRQSGGNPLFARELGAHRAHTGDRHAVPHSLKDLMAERLGRLNELSTRLLRVTALLGSSATVSMVTRVLASDVPLLVECIERLESDGILTVEGTQLRLHESWQQSVAEQMGPANRSALSLQSATALISEGESALSIDDAWRAGELFAIAGDTARSHQHLMLAADRMLGLGLPDEAATILLRAQVIANTPARVRAVNRRLAEAHLTRGDLPGAWDATSEFSNMNLQPRWSEGSPNDLIATLCYRIEAATKSHIDCIRELRWLERLSVLDTADSQVRQFACYTGIRHALHFSEFDLARAYSRVSSTIETDRDDIVPALVRLIHAAEFGSSSDVLEADRQIEECDLSTASITMRCNALRFRAMSLRYAGAYQKATRVGEQAFQLATQYRQREVAVGVADFMTFIALDLEEDEEASKWISRWMEQAERCKYPIREKGLRHALRRHALQRHDYAKVVQNSTYQIEQCRSFGALSQKTGEMLTLALGLAYSGSTEHSEKLLEECLDDLVTGGAAFLLDYPSELATRLLAQLGRASQAESFANEYLRKRRVHFPRPMPPFYRALGPLWTQLAPSNASATPIR